MKKVVALSAAVAIIVGISPGSALASPDKPTAAAPTVTIVDRFERVAGNKATGKAGEKVRKFIDDAMRRSQLVADTALDTYTADIAGGKVTAVVPRGVTLKSAVVVTQEGTNEIGLGAEFENADDSTATPEPVGHSAGQGLPRAGYACRTIWFDNPVSGASDDQVYDCWEKFKKSNSEYIYNRYSKFTVGQTSAAVRREVQEFTVRFREAKNYSRITGGPYNYGPLPGSVQCTQGKFSYGGLEIPLVSCGGIANLAGGSYHQTGTRYSGHESYQQYIDSYARFTSNGTAPIFSDYVWATTSSCGWVFGIPCINGLNKFEETWNDGAWTR
jgi:hypothetical protein